MYVLNHPKKYRYRCILDYYPCDYARSKEEADFTIVTNCRFDENTMPIGTYHLNYVLCSCPLRTDKKNPLLPRIQALFSKKIQKQENLSNIPRENCRVHFNNFDVYLRSNLPPPIYHLGIGKPRFVPLLTSVEESLRHSHHVQFIDLFFNPNLSSLPKGIFNLPNTCIIDINGCNFSPTVLDGLRESTSRPDYRGPQISHVMLNNNPNQNVEPTIEKSLDKLYAIINKVPNKLPARKRIETLRLATRRTQTLRTWSDRLCHTSDYKQSQKKFITKIISYLEKATEDEGFRKIFFTTINDAVNIAVRAYQNSTALSVLQLGINYQLETIDLNDIQKLHHLLTKGVWALKILHEVAREHASGFLPLNKIALYLEYSIKLKKQLNLPIDVIDTVFFNYSAITPRKLKAAKEIVLATINDKNELPNFLINQPKWIESLKHNYKEEYQSIIYTKDNDGNRDDPDYMKINNTYKTELKALTIKVLGSLEI